MIYQPNNIVMLNRGDSYNLPVTVWDDWGRIYEPKDKDAIYFGIMDPQQPFEDALVKKKLVVDNSKNTAGLIHGPYIVFNIEPEDTIDLIPGKYYYAVKIKMDHYLENPETGEKVHISAVNTVINKTKFIILE